MLTIFRPHVDIEKSVNTLSDHDIFLVGRLNCSLLVKTILGRLGLIIYDSSAIDTDPFAKFYWNGGKPFLNDLVYYYNVADDVWIENGGGGYDYLADVEEVLHDCEHIENEGKWTESMAMTHKLAMLKRDHFWYQRKFLDYRHLEINDASMFEKGKPRKIGTNQVNKLCRVITNV